MRLLLGWALVGCSGAPAPDAAVAPSSARPGPAPVTGGTGDAARLPDVLLISLDTTRADALSVYGSVYGSGYGEVQATTPHLDALATGGVRFAWALAHAPTTLSSHASVFTGLDPHRHRVPRNGFPLASGIPTLAERFAEAGYQTVGVIGASALGASTGISRGFQTWDADLAVQRRVRHEALAADVTDRALARVRDRDGRPLFLFVHYFDAHGPYEAPAPWTRRFGAPEYHGAVDGSPESVTTLSAALRRHEARPEDVAELRARYLGEVAYVDAEVGRLLDQGFGGVGAASRESAASAANGASAVKSPWVVVFGDHGERLGEPGFAPIGHGQDVDLAAIHVPWILSGPGLPAALVERPVALSDLGATLLGRLGLGGLGEGRDLAPFWTGAGLPEAPIFSEATQPGRLARKDAWPNLDFQRAVARDGHLLLVSPLLPDPPALYRIAAGQPPVEDRPRAERLRAELAAWDAAAPSGAAAGTIAAEQQEALRALGYAD